MPSSDLQGRSDGKVTQRRQAGFRVRRGCQDEDDARMKRSWDPQGFGLGRSAVSGLEGERAATGASYFTFSTHLADWL